ncbi:hypothetical protein ACX40Y_09285 [Sphingomonas sp. RS6]
MRANRMMWFLAGAVTMAMYLMGPHAIVTEAYALGHFAGDWVRSR